MTDAPRPLPQLFIAGDSTANNSTDGECGWGEVIGQYLDTSRIAIQNRAIGARSTRTFLREGHWQAILDDARPGDWVLIQFGHNDLHPIDDARERGTLAGIGSQSKDVTLRDGSEETVHTYGHYLRRFIGEARLRGLTPVVLSWVPMCPRDSERPTVPDEPAQYALWAEQVAELKSAAFLDVHHAVSVKYAAMKPKVIKQRYFSANDDVHTVEAGAKLNAATIVELLAALPGFDPVLIANNQRGD